MKDLLFGPSRHAASKLDYLRNNEHDSVYSRINAEGWLFSMRFQNSGDQHYPEHSMNTSELDFKLPRDVFDSFVEDTANFSGPDHKTVHHDIADLYRICVPILLVACFLSFLFNIVIVFSVRWLRRNLSPTMCLSLSLAVADAYASLVIAIGLIVNSLLPIAYGYELSPMTWCFILSLEAFRLGGLVVSVLHLQALAINHYVGILRPLHYAHIVTRKTTLTAIALMWIFPVLFFHVYFSSIPDDGFQSEQCSKHTFLMHFPFRVTTSVLFFFPLMLMTLMYSHMFILVRQHQRDLLHCPSSRSLHKNIKAIITTLLILGTYILGWMPAVLFFVLTCLDCVLPFLDIPLETRVPIGIFINAMIVAKSFVDPVIYVVRMPEIKCALKAVWFTRCGQNGEYWTPTPSRTDTRRLTFVTSRRRSRLSPKNLSPNNVVCTQISREMIDLACFENGMRNGKIAQV